MPLTSRPAIEILEAERGILVQAETGAQGAADLRALVGRRSLVVGSIGEQVDAAAIGLPMK
jgi:hypothetical protein